MKSEISRPVLKYIPVAEYTIGLCYSGHYEPYKTVNVKADSLGQAMKKGRQLLNPSIIENVRHVSTRPNPDHVAAMARQEADAQP